MEPENLHHEIYRAVLFILFNQTMSSKKIRNLDIGGILMSLHIFLLKGLDI